MRYIDWDEEKNKKLKEERGISFAEVLVLIQEDKIVEVIDHPNQNRYPDQKIFIVIIDEYDLSR